MKSHAFRFTAVALAVMFATVLSAPACADDSGTSVAHGDWYRAFGGGQAYPVGDPAIEECTLTFLAPNPDAATKPPCAPSSDVDPFQQVQISPDPTPQAGGAASLRR